jgi:hypothetical protein
MQQTSMLEDENAAGLRVDVEAARHVITVEGRGAAFNEELGPLGSRGWKFLRVRRQGWGFRGKIGGSSDGRSGVIEVQVEGVKGAFAAVGGGVGAVAVFWGGISRCIEVCVDWDSSLEDMAII